MTLESEVVNLFNSGFSMRAIHRKLGISADRVKKILVLSGITSARRIPHNKIKLTEDQEKRLVEDYLNNMSTGQLCQKYNIKSKTTIKYLLINAGVTPRKRTLKYTVDESFFETIDSPIKAYILGFMITDGCVDSHREAIEWSLAIKDKSHLIRIKEQMQYTGPVTESVSKCGDKYFGKCTLRITSSKLKKDLIALGVTPNKSATVHIPTIPPEYRIDLLRGLFDGDGSVGTYGTFEFCGNIYVTQWVADYCKELTGYEPKLRIDRRRKEWYRQFYIPKTYSLIIFDMLYNGNPVCLERKKEKYIQRR